MKKFIPLISFVLFVFCCWNYNDYLVAVRKNDELSSKKKEHEKLVKDINLYKDYEDSYLLVSNESKSLEDKLKDIEKDINTKSGRVSYYRNGIDSMNKKMK